MSQGLVKDKLLIEHISKFKWIEDYPTWQYLFNNRGVHLKYIASTVPYIMYRSNSGICRNINFLNEKNQLFLIEQEQMFEFYGVTRKFDITKFLLKYLNPYNYIRNFFNILGIKKKNERIIIEEAKEYYSLIKDRAGAFLSVLEI
jgi:hypothetical protein